MNRDTAEKARDIIDRIEEIELDIETATSHRDRESCFSDGNETNYLGTVLGSDILKLLNKNLKAEELKLKRLK